jgi:hypothetical protein
MAGFKLGKLVMTRGVHSKIKENVDFAVGVLDAFERYQRCDWGDLCDEDKAENEQALIDGDRIFAVYTCGNEKIWIITEHDRSVTTILLPEEY